MYLATNNKCFLFLQGPPGPFFARLGAAIEAEGHAICRINFNGGDRRCWPGEATDYRGSARDWPRFFDDFVRRRNVTDLVLFGDCRPLHRAAHGLATLAGIRIHVFEEGYIRPDWITLELGGVNGHSTLPKDPAWYVEAARGLPPVPSLPSIASSFDLRMREAMSYYTRATLEQWRYPGYRTHRSHWAPTEAVGWFFRFAAARRAKARAARTLQRIERERYFIFPLQLDSDSQIRDHSPFGTVRAALNYVIESFARLAPRNCVLVVKQHPLDNGLINWRRLVAAACRRFGAEGRVLFLEEGDIARLVADAQGVVTINSTTGTLAAGAGVPTVVLGEAVYNLPGITHQGPLDSFWRSPSAPDPAIWDAFSRVLVSRCLVRGGFLSEEGLDLLVSGSVERLCGRTARSAGPAAKRHDLRLNWS